MLTSAEGVVFYKLKGASKASGVRGDQEEKIVFGIIEEAGNTGTWIRDIRIKSNLGQVSAWSANVTVIYIASLETMIFNSEKDALFFIPKLSQISGISVFLGSTQSGAQIAREQKTH